jgi:hypothetical protein
MRWIPLKGIEWINRHPGISCFWRLLIFERPPGRKPFRGAEHPPIIFICKLEKQVRIGPIVSGEGQSAISERPRTAHESQTPSQHGAGSSTEESFGSGRSPGSAARIRGLSERLKDARSGRARRHERGSQLRRPYSLFSVQRRSPHRQLNIRTVRPRVESII